MPEPPPVPAPERVGTAGCGGRRPDPRPPDRRLVGQQRRRLDSLALGMGKWSRMSEGGWSGFRVSLLPLLGPRQACQVGPRGGWVRPEKCFRFICDPNFFGPLWANNVAVGTNSHSRKEGRGLECCRGKGRGFRSAPSPKHFSRGFIPPKLSWFVLFVPPNSCQLKSPSFLLVRRHLFQFKQIVSGHIFDE